MKESVDAKVSNRDLFCLLDDPKGIKPDESTQSIFKHTEPHDPSDIQRARVLAADKTYEYLGLFYQNRENFRYDLYGAQNLGFSPSQKMQAIEAELDRFAI